MDLYAAWISQSPCAVNGPDITSVNCMNCNNKEHIACIFLSRNKRNV